MWFGVLGRLEVRRADGLSAPISGPARRMVLAALLCRHGSLVTVPTLVEDLWAGTPPRSAVGTLRSHIARLRDDLGRDAAALHLVTEGDGYRLTAGVDGLDAVQFERFCADAVRTPDPEAAIAGYDRALNLWRDDAYVEFPDAAFAVAERTRLAELRALAHERRTDLALQVGHDADLVPELERRVRAEPYREQGWQQLVLALYRSGRQADALGACRRARQTLAGDLGVDPGPELRRLEESVLRHDPALELTTPVVVGPLPVRVDSLRGRCPYLGLAGFGEQDSALFVGREKLTSTVVSRLADQSVVLVVGASGVGKSSLLRAGVVPALRAGALPGSAAWRIDVRTPTERVFADDDCTAPDLLVLDQAEELFVALDPEDEARLLHQLAGYVNDRNGRLILVLRGDFFSRLADLGAHIGWADRPTVLIGRMRDDELRRALVEPAAAAGLRLEAALVEAIMHDVAGQPEPLPLLSAAMIGTWEQRDGDLLTLEGYRRTGGFLGALEAAAETCYAALDDAEQHGARQLLVRMATRTQDAWVRRPLGAADVGSFSADHRRALDALISARLVLAGRDHVELAHESLLTHWPRLHAWLDERDAAATLLAHLSAAALAWNASGRAGTDLYRGPRLTAAIEWHHDHSADLTDSEEEYLDASVRAANGELEAVRARVVREVRGRRTLRRVVIGLIATVVVAVAGAGVAIHERSTASTQARRARQAALTADARRLAALSVTVDDIATSSLLAVAAYRLQDTADTRSALLSAVERNQSAIWRLPLQHRPQRLVAAPGGSLLATIDNRRDIEIIDRATRRQIARFPANGFEIAGITADARDVVVFGPANDEAVDVGRVSLVDVSTGQRARVITTGADTSGIEPAMSDDGHWLIVPMTPSARSAGHPIEVFDATDWSAPPHRMLLGQAPVAVSAGRTSVAVELTDGSVEVRDLTSLRETAHVPAPPHITLHAVSAAPIAVSDDGSRLAVPGASNVRTVQLYTVGPSGTTSLTLPTQPAGTAAVAFSPDGADLAVGGLGGSLSLYRTVDGTQAAQLAGHTGAVLGMAWTGDEGPLGLYTASLDSQLISWNVAALPRAVTESGPALRPADREETFGDAVVGLTPPQGTVPATQERATLLDRRTGRSVSWSLGLNDGDYVNQAVASVDGRRALVSIETPAGQNRIEIWDPAAGHRSGRLLLPPAMEHFDAGLVAAISPDGTTAYSSLGPTRIGVFDLPSGRYRREFSVHFAPPDSARLVIDPWMFDPHGRLLVGGADGGPAAAGTPRAAGPPNQRLGLLDVDTGRWIAQRGLGDISYPTAVAWSHDATRLAVGTYDGTLSLYAAATLTLQTGAGVIEAGSVTTTSFSPDDRTVLTAGTRGDIGFYNVPDLQTEGRRLTIGDGPDNGAAFAWFTDRGTVEGYAADVTAPNAGGQRRFLFAADPGSLVSSACGVAGTNLTRDQWRRYLGDRPYRRVCP